MFLFSREPLPCPECQGTGTAVVDDDTKECFLCEGTGVVDSYPVTWVAYLLMIALIGVGSCLWQ